MAGHIAKVSWKRGNDEFDQNKYSRVHDWAFDGGAVISASASPAIVPTPWSDPALIDPEEAFVASLSSCHMLFYLHRAREAGFVVESYEDEAIGKLGPGPNGGMALAKVTLNPKVVYSGTPPTREEEEKLHHQSHQDCFIANSVTTKVVTNLE